MKFHVPKTHTTQPLGILRKAGYSHFIDPLSKKESYVLRITGEYYPRFHLYVKDTVRDVIFDLHLDQKKASYAGSNMHGGEYDGPAVEREMQRIKDWVAAETGYREGRAAPTPAPQCETQRQEEQKPEDDDIQTRKEGGNLFGGIF